MQAETAIPLKRQKYTVLKVIFASAEDWSFINLNLPGSVIVQAFMNCVDLEYFPKVLASAGPSALKGI